MGESLPFTLLISLGRASKFQSRVVRLPFHPIKKPRLGVFKKTKNMSTNTQIYDSTKSKSPAVEEIKDVLRYKDLIIQLVRRDIISRYKRSFLGILWTMLNPLGTMIVMSIVFSRLFDVRGAYPAFIITNLLAFNFFSQTTTIALSSMLWGSELFQRIYKWDAIGDRWLDNVEQWGAHKDRPLIQKPLGRFRPTMMWQIVPILRYYLMGGAERRRFFARMIWGTLRRACRGLGHTVSYMAYFIHLREYADKVIAKEHKFDYALSEVNFAASNRFGEGGTINMVHQERERRAG